MTQFASNDGLAARAHAESFNGRRFRWHTGLIGLAAVALCAGTAAAAMAAPGDEASAALTDGAGNEVGTVELTEMQSGTLVVAKLTGLPEGAHAFHVHTTGQCEPPFTSAGGHYNPAGAKHGFSGEGGPHAGDMPNIHVPASGALTIEVFNANLAVDDSLLDGDGAAIVIHEGPDDYESDPAGDAGPRIACGVIKGPN